ncbi:MAG: siderophore-interacting protein [Actinomycetota bacterium]
MSVLQKARQYTVKNAATVCNVEQIGDDLVHVVAEVAQPDLSWSPGQAVAIKIEPGATKMRLRWRHYTVRSCDPATGAIEFVMALHDRTTAAARFIMRLEPGTAFTFMGPGGSPVLQHDADSYLFVGDRTSVASIAAMLDALAPAAPQTKVIIATPHPDEAQLPSTHPHDVRWLPAADAAETKEVTLAALPEHVSSDTRAYVTGEMNTMRAVRSALQQAGVSRRRIGCVAHWTPDRQAM